MEERWSGRPRQDRAMAQGLVPLGQAPGGLFICSSTDPLSHADDDAISVCKETNERADAGQRGLIPGAGEQDREAQMYLLTPSAWCGGSSQLVSRIGRASCWYLDPCECTNEERIPVSVSIPAETGLCEGSGQLPVTLWLCPRLSWLCSEVCRVLSTRAGNLSL